MSQRKSTSEPHRKADWVNHKTLSHPICLFPPLSLLRLFFASFIAVFTNSCYTTSGRHKQSDAGHESDQNNEKCLVLGQRHWVFRGGGHLWTGLLMDAQSQQCRWVLIGYFEFWIWVFRLSWKHFYLYVSCKLWMRLRLGPLPPERGYCCTGTGAKMRMECISWTPGTAWARLVSTGSKKSINAMAAKTRSMICRYLVKSLRDTQAVLLSKQTQRRKSISSALTPIK